MDTLLSLYPPGSATDADGMLLLGGCRADELADEFQTPVLVVSELLRARAREYAEGLGLDVAGGGEIITALKAGADPARLVLHGNAKSDEEIAMVAEHQIGLVAVDNADDVDRLAATVPRSRTQDVLVRVIPGVTAHTHAHVLTGHAGSKFGLAPAAAAELIQRIEHSPRLRMQGLHVHVAPRSWISSRSRSRWCPLPRWASSPSTTSAAASGPATRMTTSHPPSAPTSTP